MLHFRPMHLLCDLLIMEISYLLAVALKNRLSQCFRRALVMTHNLLTFYFCNCIASLDAVIGILSYEITNQPIRKPQ